MFLFYIALAFAIIISLVFIILRSKGATPVNMILKAISSVAFILIAFVSILINPKALIFGLFVIIGAVFGLVGDISLDLKCIYKKDENIFLKTGFLFFLVGHIFYSIGLIIYNKFSLLLVLLCIVTTIVISGVNILLEKPLKLCYGKYKLITFSYVIFLALTTVLSLISAITTGNISMIVYAIGAVLFLLSDAVLSMTYFGKGCDKPAFIFINHLLYYAGQIMIACSVILL